MLYLPIVRPQEIRQRNIGPYRAMGIVVEVFPESVFEVGLNNNQPSLGFQLAMQISQHFSQFRLLDVFKHIAGEDHPDRPIWNLV